MGGWFDSTVLVLSLALISVPTWHSRLSSSPVLLGVLRQTGLAAHNRLGLRHIRVPDDAKRWSWAACLVYVIGLLVSRTFARLRRLRAHRRAKQAAESGPPSCTSAHSSSPVATSWAATSAPSWAARSSPRASSTSTASAEPCGTPSSGEPQTVVSVTTVLVLVYIIANLLVDLLYAVLDPRIRYE